MPRMITHVALVVRDYDAEIEFYTRTLGFRLLEERLLPDEPRKRWMPIAPPGTGGRVAVRPSMPGISQSIRIAS